LLSGVFSACIGGIVLHSMFFEGRFCIGTYCMLWKRGVYGGTCQANHNWVKLKRPRHAMRAGTERPLFRRFPDRPDSAIESDVG
jgi:hypothetical protein